MKTAALRELRKFRESLEGLPPETVALILSLGVVLGVFPVYGLPTLLCAGAAIVFRVNLPAVQIVNQACSPLQFALLIPLARAGAWMSGAGNAGNLAGAARNAVVGWACFCVPLGLVLYLVLAFALRRCPQPWFNGLESTV